MRVFGIDCNTKYLAIAMFEDNKLVETIILPEDMNKGIRDPFTRLIKIMNDFDDFLNSLFWWDGYNVKEYKGTKYAYVEEIPFVRSAKVMRDLCAVVACTRYVLNKHYISSTEVNVSLWKKETIGNGKAQKEEVKAWVLANIPNIDTALPQDLYDAIAIAWRGVLVSGS